MRTQTIGAELEGGMVNAKTGCPVISLEVLGGGIKDPTIPFQELTSDAGISTFEAVSTPCVNGRHITRSLDGALGWMPSGYEPKFDPMPFGPRVAIADKERYGVLREGARREHPNGFDGIFKVAPLCASQFHIGVRGLDTHTVQLLNVLNASAPHMRTQGIREYGLTHLVGHNSCWFDWFDPRRGPAPRWFSGVEELSNFARSIPKMTTKVDGRWVLAPEGEGSDLYDPEAVTTIWWAVRPRLDLGTFEMRPGWPSMKPTQMGLLADEILVMLDAFWQLVPEVVEGRDSASTRELVRKLSQVTWLVPETLPSDDMWMKQFLH